MTTAEFANLKYGNVIKIPGGDLAADKLFMVLHTNKDPQGNTMHVGLIECIDLNAAAPYQLVSTASSETVLQGRTIPGE